jgi:hypothetical protein
MNSLLSFSIILRLESESSKKTLDGLLLAVNLLVEAYPLLSTQGDVGLLNVELTLESIAYY